MQRHSFARHIHEVHKGVRLIRRCPPAGWLELHVFSHFQRCAAAARICTRRPGCLDDIILTSLSMFWLRFGSPLDIDLCDFDSANANLRQAMRLRCRASRNTKTDYCEFYAQSCVNVRLTPVTVHDSGTRATKRAQSFVRRDLRNEGPGRKTVAPRQLRWYCWPCPSDS